MKKITLIILCGLTSYSCSGMSHIRSSARFLATHLRKYSQQLPTKTVIRKTLKTEAKSLIKDTFSPLIYDGNGGLRALESPAITLEALSTGISPLKNTIKTSIEIARDKNPTSQDLHNYYRYNPTKFTTETIKTNMLDINLWKGIARAIGRSAFILAKNRAYDSCLQKIVPTNIFRWARPQINALIGLASKRRWPSLSDCALEFLVENITEVLAPYDPTLNKKCLYAFIGRSILSGITLSTTSTIAKILNYRRVCKKIENNITNQTQIQVNYENSADTFCLLKRIMKKIDSSKSAQRKNYKRYLSTYIQSYLETIETKQAAQIVIKILSNIGALDMCYNKSKIKCFKYIDEKCAINIFHQMLEYALSKKDKALTQHLIDIRKKSSLSIINIETKIASTGLKPYKIIHLCEQDLKYLVRQLCKAGFSIKTNTPERITLGDAKDNLLTLAIHAPMNLKNEIIRKLDLEIDEQEKKIKELEEEKAHLQGKGKIKGVIGLLVPSNGQTKKFDQKAIIKNITTRITRAKSNKKTLEQKKQKLISLPKLCHQKAVQKIIISTFQEQEKELHTEYTKPYVGDAMGIVHILHRKITANEMPTCIIPSVVPSLYKETK